MDDWPKRLAIALLFGFFAFLFAVPMSCAGFVVYNEHLYGDVQSGGPAALLKAFGVAVVVSVLVSGFVWRRLRPRSSCDCFVARIPSAKNRD